VSGIKILRFHKFEKNTLKAFLEAGLPSGLCIRDLTYHVKGDNRWIGYPSRAYEDGEGNTKYQPIIWFSDKNLHWDFQKQLLAALDEYLEESKK
jgi:hypothetical protein